MRPGLVRVLLSTYDSARFVRPRQVRSLVVNDVHAVVDVKEVPGHARQCASVQSVAITSVNVIRRTPASFCRPVHIGKGLTFRSVLSVSASSAK